MEGKAKILICKHCGKAFCLPPNQQRRNRKYCSPECAAEENRIHRRLWDAKKRHQYNDGTQCAKYDTKDGEGWRALGSGIVMQAINDYADAQIKLLRGDLTKNQYSDLRARVVECDKFFDSEWCAFLSDINTEWLRGEILRNAKILVAKEERAYAEQL